MRALKKLLLSLIMKKLTLILFSLCFGFGANSQVQVVGHNFLNNRPLKNTKIIVKDGAVITNSLDTKDASEFTFEVDFGRNYQVYVQNEKCAVMYFEVIANAIPAKLYDEGMNHTFDVEFFEKQDETIDTTKFKDPFYRIIFNGKRKMVEDTVYTRVFDYKLHKIKPKAVEKEATAIKDEPTIFAGKVFLNNDKLMPLKNKPIYAIDKTNQVTKSTTTNRYGVFVFNGVKPSQMAKIKMELHDATPQDSKEPIKKNNAMIHDLLSGNFAFYNSHSILLKIAQPISDYCEWNLSSGEVESLIDENYTTNIGGKLVSSSPKEKKFFANKTVYLLDKDRHVIAKTKTNMLGSFVFENIKPDNTYLISVDEADLVFGEKIDMLTKDDSYIATLDSKKDGKASMKINSTNNSTFNKLTVEEEEMKMDIKATIFGDNVNHPIGKLKIILLNDAYQPIDSVITDNLGTFKFKYLPFLKRFYLSADNTDASLDEFKNILIYSGDQTLIKVLTHQKGKRFTYNPVSGELMSLRDLELEDPWMEFIGKKESTAPAKRNVAPKAIIENILFETNEAAINAQAKETLDKIILVMNTNTQLKIEIGAHTDSKGTAEANQILSEKRAKTVLDYMTASGISLSRINSKGYGESKLLTNCGDNQPCSEQEHAKNRRIEFKILEE
jgi:outer membrane protein OmpA-like peptidoglycan-associated protein